MALVWPVYNGREPTRGGPWANISAPDAISLFELSEADFLSDLDKTPRFGDQRREFFHEGFRHIVIEIEPDEARRSGLKPGFYISRVDPEEAFRRLIEHAFVGALGSENVVRVEYSSTTDSSGNDAIRITVVIAPGAVKRLREGAALDALVRLRERLRDMREERNPIIEYATEAELAQNAGH
ncbi:hypothetical protein [Chelativorans intermedius]|uniref:Uncharacterized protein n=1 Tax=Chelativorans intermedius TaxID=515947 RepID=A0ABV6D9B2_9HYPH|nr:hypothetical protein [Chelativorans intermedius]MCT8999991.1 hypothetical protein [Chelativorans intermedius]